MKPINKKQNHLLARKFIKHHGTSWSRNFLSHWHVEFSAPATVPGTRWPDKQQGQTASSTPKWFNWSWCDSEEWLSWKKQVSRKYPWITTMAVKLALGQVVYADGDDCRTRVQVIISATAITAAIRKKRRMRQVSHKTSMTSPLKPDLRPTLPIVAEHFADLDLALSTRWS